MTTYRSERNTIEDDGETPDALQRPLEAARSDPTQEPVFFRAVLDAPLFALRPLSDDHARARLLLFKRPDGLPFCPCFTTLARAHVAAGHHFAPICLPGRELLSAMPGMTWVIDLNDSHCTLYPEEVAMLLQEGALPQLSWEHLGGRRVHARAPVRLPVWLAPQVQAVLSEIEGVHAAHVAEIMEEQTPEAPYLLVTVEAEQAVGERAGRPLTLALLPFCERSTVDVVTLSSLPRFRSETSPSRSTSARALVKATDLDSIR